jgi:aspartyl-tRNA(Asn)/glutamyl-tRNA(Gln) amidotransferase subunit C
MLTRDDIRKVATLARLEFSERELVELTEQLGKIVSFVEQLGEVDTTEVEPLAHPLDLHSVVREDRLSEGLSRESALANAPNHDDQFFLVPPVMART